MKASKLRVETKEYSILSIENLKDNDIIRDLSIKDCIFEIKNDVIELDINYCEDTSERNPVNFKTKPFIIDYPLVITLEKYLKRILKNIQDLCFFNKVDKFNNLSIKNNLFNLDICIMTDGIQDCNNNDIMYSFQEDIRFNLIIPFRNNKLNFLTDYKLEFLIDFEFHKLHLILDFIKLYKKRYLKNKMF